MKTNKSILINTILIKTLIKTHLYKMTINILRHEQVVLEPLSDVIGDGDAASLISLLTTTTAKLVEGASAINLVHSKLKVAHSHIGRRLYV